VAQLPLLILVAYTNRYHLNPDAVSYIQLANHYVQGEWRLGVSGYWGPLLTWLMVPLIAFGTDPMVAARVVMVLSGVLFLAGAVAALRALQLPRSAVVLGAWVIALTSVMWSVENITPDLLLSGIVCFAIGQLLSTRWITSRRTQLSAGLLFGAAFLAKAAALPTALACTVSIGFLWFVKEHGALKPVARAAGVTALGLLLVATPWIGVLSFTYGKLVVSTSGPVAHALSGPKDVDRSPGIKRFHTPEPGRLAAWEDPPTLEYRYWSPFDSLEYFTFQLSMMYHHGRIVMDFLSGFDFLHLGLVAALVGLLVHTPWRENIARDRWRWALLPIVCVAGAYLPTYAGASGDQRYYYATLPFLLGASFGLVATLTSGVTPPFNLARALGMALVVGSFLQTPLLNVGNAIRGQDQSYAMRAEDLAMRLRAAGRQGSIAAVGTCLGEIPPPFVAFFLNQVFHGCEANPTLASVKQSNAALLLTDRKLPLVDEMARDPELEDLDSTLFKSPAEAANYPLKIFRVRK
jgi:hypothetical protein